MPLFLFKLVVVTRPRPGLCLLGVSDVGRTSRTESRSVQGVMWQYGGSKCIILCSSVIHIHKFQFKLQIQERKYSYFLILRVSLPFYTLQCYQTSRCSTPIILKSNNPPNTTMHNTILQTTKLTYTTMLNIILQTLSYQTPQNLITTTPGRTHLQHFSLK